jgi:hypothetical protein
MAKDLIVRIKHYLFKKNKRIDTFSQSSIEKIMIFHPFNIKKYVYNFIITKL